MPTDRSPRIAWTDAGAPLSQRFGDVYFSREDGLAEARAVFLDGCGLPEAWTRRRRFVVAELGFGTGLNIAALIDLWIKTRETGARLHIFSVEGFPLTRDEAAQALAGWPELTPVTARLLDQWPARTPGFHRLEWSEINVTLDLVVGDVVEALAAWSGQADAWFLDGFAPSANPQMWSEAVLDQIAAKSAPGARAGTFTVAGAVRRGLAARGFAVEKRQGYGRKRERLEAAWPGRRTEGLAGRVAVIGAGVAGAAVTLALRELGVSATVFEEEVSDAKASGFPSALVTPRLDAGDTGIANLFAQALERAGDWYRRADAVVEAGVLQLETAPRDASRFAKIANQPWWASGAMEVVDPAAVAARTGEPSELGGLWMRDALAIAPDIAIKAWLGEAPLRTESVAALQPRGSGWRLLDHKGAILEEVDSVVIAAGWGAASLAPNLGMTPVRGQADWVVGPTASPAAWGGYVAPNMNGLLFGATHDRGETDTTTTDEASARNLAQLASRFPTLASEIDDLPRERRAAVRATTRDRLPVAGVLPGAPGRFVLSGLGSRGFCLAPLLAEHVAALIADAPSPLPLDLAARIDPARWIWPPG